MRGLARCPLTAAYLACTPPDRPCPRVPVLHVRRLINSLLSRHHGADPLYDVTPDLRGEEESTDALAMSNASMLDPARFVRVHERTGLTLEGAQDALRILSSGASASVAPANEAALDPVNLPVANNTTRRKQRRAPHPTHEAARARAQRTHTPAAAPRRTNSGSKRPRSASNRTTP